MIRITLFIRTTFCRLVNLTVRIMAEPGLLSTAVTALSVLCDEDEEEANSGGEEEREGGGAAAEEEAEDEEEEEEEDCYGPQGVLTKTVLPVAVQTLSGALQQLPRYSLPAAERILAAIAQIANTSAYANIDSDSAGGGGGGGGGGGSGAGGEQQRRSTDALLSQEARHRDRLAPFELCTLLIPRLMLLADINGSCSEATADDQHQLLHEGQLGGPALEAVALVIRHSWTPGQPTDGWFPELLQLLVGLLMNDDDEDAEHSEDGDGAPSGPGSSGGKARVVGSSGDADGIDPGEEEVQRVQDEIRRQNQDGEGGGEEDDDDDEDEDDEVDSDLLAVLQLGSMECLLQIATHDELLPSVQPLPQLRRLTRFLERRSTRKAVFDVDAILIRMEAALLKALKRDGALKISSMEAALTW
jgi:hypothetical protein